MAEQEKNLSVAQMREILKSKGVKSTSTMRKAQLQEQMVALGLLEEEKAVSEASEKVFSNNEENENRKNENTENRKPYVFRGRNVRTDHQNQTRTENIEKAERQENHSAGHGGSNNYNNRRNSMNQRSENYQRNDSYQKNDSYQRSDSGQSEEENEIPGYGQLDSGMMANGILEVIPEGFGFIRCENYMPGSNDVYVSPAQIRRFNLRTGDIVCGNIKVKTEKEKFSALLYIRTVNGMPPYEAQRRGKFEDMTPIFPNHRINLETPNAPVSMRIMDLVSPIGRGQRGMIVSPPKTGKTTLLKQVAKAIHTNYPDMQMIILLIDERPEEVTDIKEYIEGENVEVIYSTFDETPEHHKRVSEMVLERAKRLVEHKKDVVILLDSITRLARAYNLTVPPSGRTLSGGLDPAALHMPKKFFGAARNMREGGSLTVLATALVETGSKMDDVVFEEFKGTGNMELVLDRKLSEKRIFPAINIPRSGTRREELLLDKEELEAMYVMRKALNGMKSEEALEQILDMFMHTKSNDEFVNMIRHTKMW